MSTTKLQLVLTSVTVNMTFSESYFGTTILKQKHFNGSCVTRETAVTFEADFHLG